MGDLVVVEKAVFLNFIENINKAVCDLKNENIILENVKLKNKGSRDQTRSVDQTKTSLDPFLTIWSPLNKCILGNRNFMVNHKF